MAGSLFRALALAGLALAGSRVGASAPPPGLLTPLEAERHARFVAERPSGPVDLVFIGNSSIDFWRYEWGGRSVWNATYAPRRAINLGVEGAHANSVLWRLRDGELDGFTAKVVVIQAMASADVANHDATAAEVVKGNAAIVAEVRRAQPRARILLVTVPTGLDPSGRVETAARAAAAEFARHADGRRIRYLDLSDRLLSPDGRIPARFQAGRGNALNAAGYAAWAGAMDPILARMLN